MAATSCGPGYEVRHLLASEAGKLSGLLAESLAIETTLIRSLIDIGAVYVDKVRSSPGAYDVVVSKGAYLRVHLQVHTAKPPMKIVFYWFLIAAATTRSRILIRRTARTLDVTHA
jgi:hypothetical protein